MFPISDQMAQAIRESYTATSSADVYFNGSLVTSVPIVEGRVTIDRTANVRRQCNITIGDPSFVPLYVNSPLAPYGAELRLYTGIEYMDGTTERIPLGVFGIQDADWEESTGSMPVVDGYDRSQRLIDADFLFPIDASGKSAQQLITWMAGQVSSAKVLFDQTLVDYVMPGGTVFDSKRWDAIRVCAEGMGAEAYFDLYGNLVVVPVPSLTQSTPRGNANWTIDAGPNGVLVKAKRGVTRVGVYNCVVARGSANSAGGPAPLGFAADTDPRSPTYWGPASALPFGPYVKTPYGQVTYIYTNNGLTSAQQCTIAAQAQLANFLGTARSLDFTAVPNPALDGGDIVIVDYLNGQSELHLIDTLEIPLGPKGQFRGTTRTLTYQSTGGT